MADPQAQTRCHCGQPATREADPDPFEGRMDGYCDACSWARCDCYPDECPVKYPPPRRFVRQEPRPVPQAQDAHAAGLATVARKTLEVGGIPQEPEKAVSEWLANNDWAIDPESSWVPYEETWYPLAQGVLYLASRLEELEQERSMIVSVIDWCLGYATTSDNEAWRERLIERLQEARALAAVSVADIPQEDTE